MWIITSDLHMINTDNIIMLYIGRTRTTIHGEVRPGEYTPREIFEGAPDEAWVIFQAIIKGIAEGSRVFDLPRYIENELSQNDTPVSTLIESNRPIFGLRKQKVRQKNGQEHKNHVTHEIPKLVDGVEKTFGRAFIDNEWIHVVWKPATDDNPTGFWVEIDPE